MHTPYEYVGDPGFESTTRAALEGVIDPEMALNIVTLGLVQRVEVAPRGIFARITMTSAACPVTEYIVEETGHALRGAFPGTPIDVELTWEPPWSPERMSPSARRAMGWD
jgi:metal-sulfur cluster biosynthetic enzyme